jgi:hypothetical protein
MQCLHYLVGAFRYLLAVLEALVGHLGEVAQFEVRYPHDILYLTLLDEEALSESVDVPLLGVTFVHESLKDTRDVFMQALEVDLAHLDGVVHHNLHSFIHYYIVCEYNDNH